MEPETYKALLLKSGCSEDVGARFLLNQRIRPVSARRLQEAAASLSVTLPRLTLSGSQSAA
jgi:hypothetical protein